MKKRISKWIKLFYKEYKFHDRTKAFKSRYKNVEKKLFNRTLNHDVIKEYKDKWGVFGKKVETKTFLLCYNLSGKIDYNIVPENLFAAILEPALNPYKELAFFSTKNIYEKWFDNKKVFPDSYFHKIDDIYYDKNFMIIEDIDIFLKNSDFKFPIVLKPSRETYGGAGIKVVKNMMGLLGELDSYKDLIGQEMIKQHEYLNNINPGINSIRTCLYRTENGTYKVINNSIRFGVNGGLDNLSAGGIVCNINNDGSLNEFAVNKYAVKFHKHPNSNIAFSDISIPFYNELNQTAGAIANEVPLSNLLSLDMCLDKDNNWRCLELNIKGQTIRFVQYAGKGFFGNYTQEVINKYRGK